jgi:hypothetical protein
MTGYLSIATLKTLKHEGVAQMNEFLSGLAFGAMFAGAVVYAMLCQGRAERRPVPEPVSADLPTAGEKWVLRDECQPIPVTVEAVTGSRVFYGYTKRPLRNLPVAQFIRVYRRA